MCQRVIYFLPTQKHLVSFNDFKARLPVLLQNGQVKPLLWGKKANYSNSLPTGSWLSLDSIKAGKWDKFFPKPVKLPIRSFSVLNNRGIEHWFDITAEKVIQGTVIKHEKDYYVYIVMLPIQSGEYPHWPRLLFTNRFLGN